MSFLARDGLNDGLGRNCRFGGNLGRLLGGIGLLAIGVTPIATEVSGCSLAGAPDSTKRSVGAQIEQVERFSPDDAVVSTRGGLTGQVRTSDGTPARGVHVRLYPLPGGHSASVTPATKVAAPAADTAPAANTAPGANSATDTDTAPAEVHTSDTGHFNFATPPEGMVNLEAIQSEDFKTFRQSVAILKGRRTDVGEMKLARTGSIVGRVTTPGAPNVKDFLGVDVYIPGSSYVGKTDRAGRFAMSSIAPGTFTLVASKPGLGTAMAFDVTVRPELQALAPDLALALVLPKLLAVDPPSGGPGARVRVSGEALGGSSGAVLGLLFNGTPATDVDRLSDETLEATVPAGATSGNLTATVGGLPTNGLPFKVVARLVVSPPDTGLLVGQRGRLSATGWDTTGTEVKDPQVSWSANGSGVSLEGATVLALEAGMARVVAKSGQVSGSAAVHVYSGSVSRTRLSSGFFRVGLLADATASVQAVTELSSGATVSFVAYASDEPASVSIDSAGTLSAVDTHSNGRVIVRATSLLDPSSVATASARLSNAANVKTVAGPIGGGAGYIDGTRGQARFLGPQGIAVDPEGNVFVADMFNHRLRRLDPLGEVITFAGTGSSGVGSREGQDGPRREALLNAPIGVTFDSAGNLYLAEAFRLRTIRADGLVTTLIHQAPISWTGLVSTPTGDLYLTDIISVRVLRQGQNLQLLAGGTSVVDGSGGEAYFGMINALALGPEGDLFVSDGGCNCIRKVSF